jgi:DtxR family Mn-dependent transcriptional regulator
MIQSPPLSTSLEDYLGTIYHLVRENKVARVRDISSSMGVNMSSVTGALRQLASHNLVHYEPYQVITLTDSGMERAKELVRRHNVLKSFLVNVLSLDPAIAEHNAHRMEHAIDTETLERLIRFAEFVERCPRGGREWIELFSTSCKTNSIAEYCEQCLKSCLKSFQDASTKKMPKAEEPLGKLSLDMLSPGESGWVVKVSGGGAIRRRIVEMGITPGTRVEIEKLAPLGDPMDVKLKGYHLSLRKEEAAGIIVRREKENAPPKDGTE